MKKVVFSLLLTIFLCSLISVKGIDTMGTFTPINTNLTLSDPYPANGTTDILPNVTLTITCTSPQGYVMNLSWYENTTGSWVLVQQNLSITNGTFEHVFNNASSYLTEYWWRVNLTDGIGWCNRTYHFTTQAAILITDEYPSDTSTNICIPLDLGITISDLNGNMMNITFWSNASNGTWTPFYLGNDNCTFANVTNGTYYFAPEYFTKYGYTYYWNVSVNNGNNTANSDVYHFTTATGPCPPEGGGSSAVISSGSGAAIAMGLLGGIPGGIIAIFIFTKRRKKKEDEMYVRETLE